ncbi:hypothetical protein HDE_07758 [Halotydeus destructor]|nr:hypothetical protein HDE_07758 [Halotydeus destructor]
MKVEQLSYGFNVQFKLHIHQSHPWIYSNELEKSTYIFDIYVIVITIWLNFVTAERCVSFYSILRRQTECVNRTECCGNTIWSHCCPDREKDFIHNLPFNSYIAAPRDTRTTVPPKVQPRVQTTPRPDKAWAPSWSSNPITYLVAIFAIALLATVIIAVIYGQRACARFVGCGPEPTAPPGRPEVSVTVNPFYRAHDVSHVSQDPPSYEYPPPYPGPPVPYYTKTVK